MNLVLIRGAMTVLTACVALLISDRVPAQSSGPTCADLRTIFRAAKKDFASLRNGQEVTARGEIFATSVSNITLNQANACFVRRYARIEQSAGFPEYYCRWDTGSNSALAQSRYLQLKAQLQSCIKQGSFSEDLKWRMSASVDINDNEIAYFSIAAVLNKAPYYVEFKATRLE